MSLNPALSWTSGSWATSHQVYLGTMPPWELPTFKARRAGPFIVLGLWRG